MTQTLKVFIGWDSREPIAFSVLAHSILTRCSMPVSIVPLSLQSLGRIYTRQRGPTESTEFSISRFLVPYLSDYEGFSLFLDSDMLCLTDLANIRLYPLADPGKAVYVCQHDYTPKDATKFLGQLQTAYPRKNWSSCMLFSNERCAALTPEYVNTASGLDLHRFHWLRDEGVEGSEDVKIGALPIDWNWLIGEYADNPHAKILHWTLGGPWFPASAYAPRSLDWCAERDRMQGWCVPEAVT